MMQAPVQHIAAVLTTTQHHLSGRRYGITSRVTHPIKFKTHRFSMPCLLQARKAAREGAAGVAALADAGKSEGIGLGASLLVASVAGCINVLLTNPIWVVITQMQAMQRHEAALARGASTWSVAKTIFRDHGIGGFFKVSQKGYCSEGRSKGGP